MTIQSIILSNKIPDRLARHLLFWAFYAMVFHFQNDNRTFLYLACFLPSCVLAVYGFGHLLIELPKRKKYSQFALGALVIFAVTLWINYYASRLFFSTWPDAILPNMIFGLAQHNQTIAMSLGGMAMGIKATKHWYFKQKKNQALEKQKARNELQLEKANLYPEFILQALNSLQLKIQAGENESPGLLMKLSDSLSYILYDSQEDMIALGKELMIVKNMIEFKKLNWAGQSTVQLTTTGNPENKHIAPLTLFRLLQSLFQMIGNNERGLTEVSIKIEIENDSLFFELSAIYSCEPGDQKNWEVLVAQTRGQLNDLYHGACEFKVADEECMYSISITLGLTRSLNFAQDLMKSKTKENVLA